FFFQAEDGIRDFHVTGVQTCALPICIGEAGGLSGCCWLLCSGVKRSAVIAGLEINDGYIGVGDFVHQATGETGEARFGGVIEAVDRKSVVKGKGEGSGGRESLTKRRK